MLTLITGAKFVGPNSSTFFNRMRYCLRISSTPSQNGYDGFPFNGNRWLSLPFGGNFAPNPFIDRIKKSNDNYILIKKVGIDIVISYNLRANSVRLFELNRWHVSVGMEVSERGIAKGQALFCTLNRGEQQLKHISELRELPIFS